MMRQAAGSFRSANHHGVVLFNWALRRDVAVGRCGCAGGALFVCARSDGAMCFVVEHRGPGFPPFRHEWPFANVPRWHPDARRWAFEGALAVFLRLSGQTVRTAA